MGRAPCCDKANVKKGPWSPQEDAKLKGYIEQHGTGGNWIALPQKIGLKRCGKSCRLRWLNYLQPNIKRGDFSTEEDNIICRLYISIGSRWSIIAAQLPGRTDNDIKNYWNTKLKKQLFGKRKEQQAQRLSSLKQVEGGNGGSTVATNEHQNPDLPYSNPDPPPNGRGYIRELSTRLGGWFSHDNLQDALDISTTQHIDPSWRTGNDFKLRLPVRSENPGLSTSFSINDFTDNCICLNQESYRVSLSRVESQYNPEQTGLNELQGSSFCSLEVGDFIHHSSQG